jgi:hypothetical protein
MGLPGPKGLRGYPGLDGAAGQKGECMIQQMQADSARHVYRECLWGCREHFLCFILTVQTHL